MPACHLSPQHITDTGITAIGNGCELMEKLNLSGLPFITNGAKRDFAPRGLVALASRCHNLVSVHLNRVFQIGAQALKAIATNSPRLQELYLQGCPKVGHKALRHVAENCPDLRVLDLFRCEKVRANHHLAASCFSVRSVRPCACFNALLV